MRVTCILCFEVSFEVRGMYVNKSWEANMSDNYIQW